MQCGRICLPLLHISTILQIHHARHSAHTSSFANIIAYTITLYGSKMWVGCIFFSFFYVPRFIWLVPLPLPSPPMLPSLTWRCELWFLFSEFCLVFFFLLVVNICLQYIAQVIHIWELNGWSFKERLGSGKYYKYVVYIKSKENILGALVETLYSSIFLFFSRGRERKRGSREWNVCVPHNQRRYRHNGVL